MTYRTDVHIHWDKSPRIVHVVVPSTTISVQDIVDTLRQKEAELGALDDDSIIDAFGKEDLGSGRFVGITAVLNNAKLYFGDRNTQLVLSTITASVGSKVLIDTTQDFVALGVKIGDVIVNLTTGNNATILGVVNSTTLEVHGIAGGFTPGDSYRIWWTEQCYVTGGNLLAVDVNGDPMDSVLPSSFTNTILSSATDAALVDGASTAVWQSLDQTWPAGSMGERMKKTLTRNLYLGLPK